MEVRLSFSLKWPLVGNTIYLYVKKFEKGGWGSNIGGGRADIKNSPKDTYFPPVNSNLAHLEQSATATIFLEQITNKRSKRNI